MQGQQQAGGQETVGMREACKGVIVIVAVLLQKKEADA